MNEQSVSAVRSREPSQSDRQGFNRRWYAENLRKVFLPENSNQVEQAMQQALNEGALPGQIQITCGRHCYEGYVYNKNTNFIIDLTGLRSYGKDEYRGYFIDVGFGNWDMYRTFNNVYGVTLPAGSCYSVGLGGHITGGGYGLLSRKYGLAIDHLTGVEIVTFLDDPKKPRLVYADENSHPDLFWAVRGGGGGNFGIITRYYFKNPPKSPSNMVAYTLSIPWEGLTYGAFANHLNEFVKEECSQDFDRWNMFSIFHLNHKQAGAMSLSTFAFYDNRDGSLEEFNKKVEQHARDQRARYAANGPISNKPAPHIGHPVWLADNSPLMSSDKNQITRVYTYLDGVQQVNGSGPNRFGKYKSAYMTEFSQEQILALYRGLQKVPDSVPEGDMAASLVQIDSYGGRINTVSATDTAIYQRGSRMKLQYQTYWDNPSLHGGPFYEQQQKGHLEWINEIYQAVYASNDGVPVEGCYYNYCDNDLGTRENGKLDRAIGLYFMGNKERLENIKFEYNRWDWFRSAQSIEPRSKY